jgi:hypothetical protein
MGELRLVLDRDLVLRDEHRQNGDAFCLEESIIRCL